MLVLARGCARPSWTHRGGCREHGGAACLLQRRGSLRRGGGTGDGSVPRQLSAGSRSPRAHQRRCIHFRATAKMSFWGAMAGGFVGTLVLTTCLRAGSEVGLTRMDLPFLLGTAFTADRTRAKALGFGLHFVAGQAFRAMYYAVFVAI